MTSKICPLPCLTPGHSHNAELLCFELQMGAEFPDLSQIRGSKTLLFPRLHVLQLVFGEVDLDAQIGIVSLCTT